MEMFDARVILVVVGALTLITNMITEVLKKLFWNIVPTNLIVVLVAQALTLLSGFGYAQVVGADILWYHVAAAVVAGLFVAYAAMFGFDKFRETWEKVGEIRARQS